MWLYHREMSPNDADGMANSVIGADWSGSVLFAHRSSLIWVCTVCPGVSVRKLRIITAVRSQWVGGSFVEFQCFYIDDWRNENQSLRGRLQYDKKILLGEVIEIWAAPSEFGTYRLCEQRRFRRACASAQSRQNLRCSLIQVVNQEEPSDRKPDPWPLWMAGHAQLKFVMTECSKTQIRLTRLI